MGEMVTRVAQWLHLHKAEGGDQPMVPWADVENDEKNALIVAARDLVLTMRRPTLEMRVRGRAAATRGDEAEVWRAMIDSALKEAD